MKKLIFTALLALAVGVGYATVHTITFVSYSYSPSSLNVLAGDTIVWSGDFSFHPLASGTIPAGAASFQNSAGSTFSYVPTVGGTYNYACQQHGVSNNMKGSFVVEALLPSVVPNTSADQPMNIHNISPRTLTVKLSGYATEPIRELQVYNMLGQPMKIVTVTDRNVIDIDVSEMPTGMYLLIGLNANGTTAQTLKWIKRL